MAEIKSTMDLVMERAAKMAANSKPVANDEAQVREGMKLAADYLNSTVGDLAAELAGKDAQHQLAYFKGAARTLLRNIVLPRDEFLAERNQLALTGIDQLIRSTGATTLDTVCAELGQILQQYGQHKEQVTKQVEDALRAQLEQQYMGKGVDTSRITATMHPQYQDEMAKMEQDLNGQYNQAMDQRKEMILQQMGLE